MTVHRLHHIPPSPALHVPVAVSPSIWGFDLGLSNGAVVRTDYHRNDATVMAQWHKESSKFETPVHAIATMKARLLDVLPQIAPGDYIGIDWTLNEFTFGRTSVYQTSTKAFLAGVLHTWLSQKRAFPVFLSPQVVRQLLGLPRNLKKELVHEAYLGEPSLPSTLRTLFITSGPDIKDAIILADVLRLVPLMQLPGTSLVYSS